MIGTKQLRFSSAQPPRRSTSSLEATCSVGLAVLPTIRCSNMRTQNRFTVGLCVSMLAILCGCDSKQTESTDMLSPDRQLNLRIEIDETGGAAVSDVTSAYLNLAKSPDADRKLIFRGSAISNFMPSWRGAREIEFSYGSGYVSTCDSTPMISADIKVDVLGCK